jgi:hypothetical protein
MRFAGVGVDGDTLDRRPRAIASGMFRGRREPGQNGHASISFPDSPKSKRLSGAAFVLRQVGLRCQALGDYMSDSQSAGIGFGCALAIAISWSVNHSILWAILHGVFSWFYVLYYAVTR